MAAEYKRNASSGLHMDELMISGSELYRVKSRFMKVAILTAVVLATTSFVISVVAMVKISSVNDNPTVQDQNYKAGEPHLRTNYSGNTGYTQLDDGWIGLHIGYQYKLTTTKQNFSASRRICQSLNGDLAVHGVQDMTNRKILERALHIAKHTPCRTVFWKCDPTWIGLHDMVKEGIWKWVNGDKVSHGTALWHPGEPNSLGNEDCGEIYSGALLTLDVLCSLPRQAICEKKWNIS